MDIRANRTVWALSAAGLLLVVIFWTTGRGLGSPALAGLEQAQPPPAQSQQADAEDNRDGGTSPAEPGTNAGSKPEQPKAEGKLNMPALQFKMKDIDGKEQDLSDYYGNVVLMVNVASKCGLTPQYEQLQAVYEKYKDKGFVILGFPANDFLRQEPGDEAQIKSFCTTNYGVTFPMFGKIKVKGREKAPLYEYLTSKKEGHEFGGAIRWNFDKFLIDRTGRIIDRFHPRKKPDDPKLIEALEAALAADIPQDSPLAAKSRKTATTQSTE